jgi:hypothetical protein
MRGGLERTNGMKLLVTFIQLLAALLNALVIYMQQAIPFLQQSAGSDVTGCIRPFLMMASVWDDDCWVIAGIHIWLVNNKLTSTVKTIHFTVDIVVSP